MKESNDYEKAAEFLEKKEYVELVETAPVDLGKATTYNVNTENDEPALLPGYHEIYSENFPSKGLFYPEGTRFFIRAASVKEIRHFSTINDEDPFSVDEALNEIVNGCLTIRIPGKLTSYKELKEEDRIHIILSIRDLTFIDGENKLAISVNCPHCGTENEIEIKNSSFESEVLSDSIMKYYDEDKRKFVVTTKSSGTIEIVPPSIGIMSHVTKYIQNSREKGKKLDASFIKCLPYLITDWRGFTESHIQNLEVEFMRWDSKKYQVYNALTEMVRIGVKEELHKECDKCYGEVRTPITFPGGIKSLFIVSDISGELL